MATRGFENFTPADVTRRTLQQHKPSKYHNVKTTLDGITFDSKKESERYFELKLLEKAGQISALELQPKFELYVVSEESNLRIHVGNYRADFAYWQRAKEGHQVRHVEDVKTPATRTQAYRMRKRMAEGIYGITITEI